MRDEFDEAQEKQQKEWEEEQERLNSESATAEAEAQNRENEPMTLEELKEKARLTDDEIRDSMVRAMDEGQLYGDDGKPLPEKEVAKVQLDKAIQTFILLCEKNEIYQVSAPTSSGLASTYELRSVKDIFKE